MNTDFKNMLLDPFSILVFVLFVIVIGGILLF